MTMTTSVTSAASISADNFFSQSSAFAKVIQSRPTELFLGARKKEGGSLEDGMKTTSLNSSATGRGGLDGACVVGKEKDESSKKLGDLIDKLKDKQQVLKNLAQFNQQQNEKELKKNRQELISALPTDPCVLMGVTAVKEELKHCASKIGGVSFSMLPHISWPGATVFRLGVIDLMSVDIVIDQSGAIKNVTVCSSSPNNSSVINPNVVTAATNLFTQFLQQAKFHEFVKYFRGWLSTYIPVLDSVKIRPKLISAISAIESDIETINRSFLNSIDDQTLKNMIKTVIHGTPCGLFQNFPKVCKPTLKYFVSPYDVMKEGKTMESDIEDIPKDAGMIAEIEFYPVNSQNILVPGDISSQTNYQLAANTPGTPVCTTPSGASTPGGGTNSGASGGGNKHSVRKMQIAPMVLSEQPLKIGQSLNPSNSAPLPVSFCLMFPKPIPMFSCYVSELHEYTKSLVCENRGDPKQWLYALSVFEGIIPDPEHNYFHSLPNCDLALSIETNQCCEHVTSSNSTYVIQGVMFSHVNALPHIVHIVRKQVALNCLMAEMMRKQTVSNTKQVNVSIPDPGRVKLKFIHPLKSMCVVTIDVEVIKPDFANPSCHISTSDATFVCEDAYPTTILRKCGSLAHLVRSVIKKCSTLRVDIATPSNSSVPSIAPPLTPTIDVKMAISFDRSMMESNDTASSEALTLPLARATSNSIQNLKLVDMLQSDLPATALTSLTSAVTEAFTYDDSLTSLQPSVQIPSGVTSLAGSMSGQQTASGNRKRARVKSTQDDGPGSHGPGKGGGKSKAAKRSMSVAGPLNVPNSPGGSSGNGNNSPAVQLQQQIQVLSMMSNPLLPLHMQPTPPPAILTPQPVTPDSSSTFDLGSTASNSIGSPATSSANMGDSKLREILNSSKLASRSSPVSSSQGQVVPPPPTLQLGAVTFEQLPPISVGGQHNPPTPLLSPSMQEFVYNQQAQAAAFAKISSFAALARQFKPSMYDMSAASGLDPSSAAAHLNYQATANAHIQQLLQPALAGVNSANSNSQSSLSGDRPSSNNLLGTGNMGTGVSPASILQNLPTPTIMSSMASEISTTATAMSKQSILPTAQSTTSENDKALKYLGDLWKQLDNKKNLSNSEIEAIERKMNQIQNNLALKDSMNQANNASVSSYKRKNSVDYTDSSSVSSNQSLGDNKNSSDFVSSNSIGMSTTPPKRSKNTGPPKRRGRPPKSIMMGDPKGHSDSNSPYSQLVPKFARSESGSQVELSGGSPVKMLKLTQYSSGGSSVGSGKLYTIKNDLDAFEMSDDSSDSGATLMSQQSTPHAVPPPTSSASGVIKKPKVVKKPRVSKKLTGSADSMSTSESGGSTTTYKSLNKSDTVIVIKKVGGPTYSQTGNSSSTVGSISKEPTSSGVSSMGSPGAQTQSQGTSSQISTFSSKDFSSSSSFKSDNSSFSFKDTSSSYLGSSKSASDSIPAVASSKINPGLENKSSPMKNLFASFAAETSGSLTSVSSLAKSASSSSFSDKDKESNSKGANANEASSFSKSLGSEVSTSSSSQQTSSSAAASSTTFTSKSSTNVLPSSLPSSKKRVGLESVVSKLNTSPVSSSGSGSSSTGFNTSAALSSSTVSKTIVASTLLKSPSSLKLQISKSDNPSGIKSSKSKSFSFEKSKHLSGDKSSTQKSSSSFSKTPGSPISAAHLPSFLKSSNKLGNFVIPKKKSGGGGGSSANDSHKHFDQSDSSRNSNGSSPSSASDSSSSKTSTLPPTVSAALTASSVALVSSENSSSKNKMGDKMFDFPLNEDHSIPTTTGTLGSKLSSKGSSGPTSMVSGPTSMVSGPTSMVSASTSFTSNSNVSSISQSVSTTLNASSGTIFSGEKSAVSIPLNRIQHPLTSYSVSSASDSSPSLDSPPTTNETSAKSSSSGSIAPSEAFEASDSKKDN